MLLVLFHRGAYRSNFPTSNKGCFHVTNFAAHLSLLQVPVLWIVFCLPQSFYGAVDTLFPSDQNTEPLTNKDSGSMLWPKGCLWFKTDIWYSFLNHNIFSCSILWERRVHISLLYDFLCLVYSLLWDSLYIPVCYPYHSPVYIYSSPPTKGHPRTILSVSNPIYSHGLLYKPQNQVCLATRLLDTLMTRDRHWNRQIDKTTQRAGKHRTKE